MDNRIKHRDEATRRRYILDFLAVKREPVDRKT